MSESGIFVKLRGKKAEYSPRIEKTTEEYKTLESWREPDGSIVIETEGKRVRVMMPP